MDDERALRDIFMAYSLPWGVIRSSSPRGPAGSPGLPTPGSPRKAGSGKGSGANSVTDAMDVIGWQQLCADCKLDEDSALPPARPVFKQIAQGNILNFDGFVKVLKAVARARYGEHDDMARLVYFKVRPCVRSS